MEKIKKAPADILWVCNTTYKEGNAVKPHKHGTYYHLMYIVDGWCDVVFNDEKLHLVPGMTLLAAPEDVHSIETVARGQTLNFLEIKFVIRSNELIHSLMKTESVFEADSLTRELIRAIIETGYSEIGNLSRIDIQRSYLLSLLYHHSRNVQKPDAYVDSFILSRVDTSGFSKATIEAIAFMEKNYMKEINLADISESIGYYKYYISAALKKDMSKSAGEILHLVRVNKAAELLMYSDYSINQIAEQTGFKNVNHFNRIFKQVTGIPPGQYRKSFPEGILLIDGRAENSDDSVSMWAGIRKKNIQAEA